jgi:YVTN family beta-propeller protein
VITNVRVALALVCLSCAIPKAHAQSLAYVANLCSNDVSVIDTVTFGVATTIPLAVSPKGVAVAPNGAFAYVVDAGATVMTVIDTATNNTIATVALGGDAGFSNLRSIAITPDGALALIPRGQTQTLAVVDTKTLAVVATIPLGPFPEGIVIEPTGAFAYVGIGIQTVAVVDIAARTVAATIDLDFSKLGPTDLAVTPNGQVVYVATQDWYLKALDPKTNTLITTLNYPQAGDWFGLAITPDGTRIYATDFFGAGGGGVAVYDTATNQFVTRIQLTSRPRDIAITLDGTLALVPGEANVSPTGNDVTLIDIATNSVIGRIPVGTCPAAVAVTPDVSLSSRLTRLLTAVDAANVDGGIGGGAGVKLTAALRAAGRGNASAVCGSLRAFINGITDKSVSAVDEDDARLAAAAYRIAVFLQCEPMVRSQTRLH